MVELRTAQWFMAVSLILAGLWLVLDSCFVDRVVEEPATVEEMEGWKREILERRRSERSV